MPEDQFVKEISEKGYWERTKGLDRVYDLCILIHLFKHNKKTYLSIYREKHRLPTIIDDELRYFLFEFPYKQPIPCYGPDQSSGALRKLGVKASNVDDSLFSFGG